MLDGTGICEGGDQANVSCSSHIILGVYLIIFGLGELLV